MVRKETQSVRKEFDLQCTLPSQSVFFPPNCTEKEKQQIVNLKNNLKASVWRKVRNQLGKLTAQYIYEFGNERITVRHKRELIFF